MDLNYLYSQEQISLIRAADTGSVDSRDYHQAVAAGFARRIASFRSEFALRDRPVHHNDDAAS